MRRLFIVNDLLSDEDIQCFSDITHRHLDNNGRSIKLGKIQPNAAVALPAIEFIFSPAPVAELVVEVLGAGNALFTGH